MDEKEKITYEIGYLLKSEAKDGDISGFIDSLKNKLGEKKGLVVSEGSPKRLPLAYPIKKEVSAIFNWLKFVLSPKSIIDIKDFLDKNTNILRYLITKVPKERPAKQIIKPRLNKKPVVKKETPLIHKETKEEKIEEKDKKEEVKEEEIDKKIEEILGE